MRTAHFSDNDNLRAGLVIHAVALEFGVLPMDMNNPSARGNPAQTLARQIAIYLFQTVYNINMARAGRAFARDPSTAKHACVVIETCREDPVLDGRISRLENFLRLAPMPPCGKRART